MSRCFGFRVINRWIGLVKSCASTFAVSSERSVWRTEVTYMWQSFTQYAWAFIPLALMVLLAFWKRAALLQALRNLHKDIGHFRRDSQLHTPRALFLNLLLALPGAIVLASLGLMLQGTWTRT